MRGVYHDWMGFERLDHQFTERNNGFIRADQDAYFDTNPNGIVGGGSLPTVARIFHRRTYSNELGDTAVLQPNLLNNARLQINSPRRSPSSIRSSMERNSWLRFPPLATPSSRPGPRRRLC